MYNLCPETSSHLCTSQIEGNATSLLQQYTSYKKKKKVKVLKRNYLITFFQLRSKISRAELLLQKTAIRKYSKPSRLQKSSEKSQGRL